MESGLVEAPDDELEDLEALGALSAVGGAALVLGMYERTEDIQFQGRGDVVTRLVAVRRSLRNRFSSPAFAGVRWMLGRDRYDLRHDAATCMPGNGRMD